MKIELSESAGWAVMAMSIAVLGIFVAKHVSAYNIEHEKILQQRYSDSISVIISGAKK